MTIETPAGTPAKIPVWKTTLECYRLTFRNLGDLLRFSWPWLLLLIAVSGALYWGFWETEQEALKTSGGSNVLMLLTLIVSTSIGAFIAVPWHRLLLLGEKQDLATGMKIGTKHRPYLLWALLLGVLPMVPLLALASLFPWGPASSETELMTVSEMNAIMALISGILIFVAMSLFTTRLALILPATAVGHSGVDWREAWAITRGNTWRLFWASVIIILPLMIFYIFVTPHDVSASAAPATIAEADELARRITFTLWSVLEELLAMFTGMVLVAFLSLAYRHFTGLPDPESTSATPPAP